MINFKFITVISIATAINLISCSKPDENSQTTTTGDLQVVPRAAAYAGCYPIVGTSQTEIWDATGNSITPVLGEVFFGQDAQFTHTTPN